MKESQESVFGLKVPDLLKNHQYLFKKNCRALDVGCANGAVTDWLIEIGHNAQGIDIAPPEERISETIKKEDIRNFHINNFDLIIALNVLQFLKFSERINVLSRFYQGLSSDGILIIESFTTNDEGYKKFKLNHIAEIEPQTFFRIKRNNFASYFLPGELKEWAKEKGLKEIFYSEGIIQDNHPPLGEHTHGIVSGIFQKNCL